VDENLAHHSSFQCPPARIFGGIDAPHLGARARKTGYLIAFLPIAAPYCFSFAGRLSARADLNRKSFPDLTFVVASRGMTGSGCRGRDPLFR
jgi:hypothetical protein